MDARRLLWLGTATVLVVLTLAGLPRPVAADPPPPGGGGWGGGWCTVEGMLCHVDASGTVTCEASGQCESEGDEEEGDTGCTPGSQVAVIDCEEGVSRSYVCNSAGEWEFIGEGPGPECQNDGMAYRVCYNQGLIYNPECWEVPPSATPCDDMDWGATGIQCLGEYGLTVSVSVPCQRVARWPYPRGMVIVPNQLWITPSSPQWAEAWSETLDYDACLAQGIGEGGLLVRNFRIGLAWGRNNAMLPTWISGDPLETRGWNTSVAWEQSSYGQAVCGPSLTPGQRLPAWRVFVYTYWNAYWRRTYERQTETVVGPQCLNVHPAGPPEGFEDVFPPPPGICLGVYENPPTQWYGTWVELCDADNNGDGIPDDECWETVDSGWVGFDLRQFGYPTSYFVSGMAGPEATTLEPDPPCSDICVPVIEVQGLIRNPRGR